MDINGLTYNTQREKLKLKAYGRDIQQMVEHCKTLPTKEERQSAAQAIVDVMGRVVPSNISKKERLPVLWYHLALMSDFQLDIDYPYDIEHEDKMAVKPQPVPYASNKRISVRHYGRLVQQMCDYLVTLPEGEERDHFTLLVANQMRRSLAAWGMGSTSKERVAYDLERLTGGVIRLDLNSVDLVDVEGAPVQPNHLSGGKKKKKKK